MKSERARVYKCVSEVFKAIAIASVASHNHRAYSMQDKDSTRSSINKRMNVVHRCIRTPNIVLRALRTTIDVARCRWVVELFVL